MVSRQAWSTIVSEIPCVSDCSQDLISQSLVELQDILVRKDNVCSLNHYTNSYQQVYEEERNNPKASGSWFHITVLFLFL